MGGLAVPSAVKPTIRAASRFAGRITASSRMLPAFLIVGAQRCGTTSMYRTLIQHPSIVGPVLHKGAHYFDTNYGRGISWYRAHFPLADRARRTSGANLMTFESSPYYLFHPLAAGRIAEDLPNVKILVLVRDPVERAYSAHTHERARGFETESFERALELEPERLRGEAERIANEPGYYSHSHQHHAYLSRGHYAEQLARLERTFGAERVHVIDSGIFFAKPEPVYDAVLDFLGLPHHDYPAFERHNARPRSPMPESLRAQLTDYFLPHDQQLTRWLEEIPSWRR